MDLFSYLLILLAIIVGMGMAQILGDVAHMIQARKRVRVYWVHLVWLAIIFLMQVQYWYVLYSWRDRANLGETFAGYLGNLLFPILLYVISVLLAPSISKDEEIDFKAYYYSQHRWVFAICALALLVLVGHSSIYLDFPFWHVMNLIRGIAIVLCIALSISANRVLHSIAGIVLIGLFVVFVALLTFRTG